MGKLQKDPCPAFIPDSSSRKPEEQDSSRTNKAGPCTVAYKSSLFIQTHLPGQSCLPPQEGTRWQGKRPCTQNYSVFFSCQGSRKIEDSQMVMTVVPSPKKDYIFLGRMHQRKEHQRGTKASRRVSQGQ